MPQPVTIQAKKHMNRMVRQMTTGNLELGPVPDIESPVSAEGGHVTSGRAMTTVQDDVKLQSEDEDGGDDELAEMWQGAANNDQEQLVAQLIASGLTKTMVVQMFRPHPVSSP